MPSFVYVLITRNPGGRAITYVGWTLDLERRLAEHNGAGPPKKSRGAKFTSGRTWVLIYAEKYRTRRRAMAREYALKRDKTFRALLRSGQREH
jgi:putative endonuclease